MQLSWSHVRSNFPAASGCCSMTTPSQLVNNEESTAGEDIPCDVFSRMLSSCLSNTLMTRSHVPRVGQVRKHCVCNGRPSDALRSWIMSACQGLIKCLVWYACTLRQRRQIMDEDRFYRIRSLARLFMTYFKNDSNYNKNNNNNKYRLVGHIDTYNKIGDACTSCGALHATWNYIQEKSQRQCHHLRLSCINMGSLSSRQNSDQKQAYVRDSKGSLLWNPTTTLFAIWHWQHTRRWRSRCWFFVLSTKGSVSNYSRILVSKTQSLDFPH